MLGQTLGQWTLEAEVGVGAMGAVYRARGADGGVAAVKVLAPELTRDDLFLSRFYREIEALRRLDHPRIVRYLDSGSDAGRVYLAIEYVDGGTYEGRLQARGRLPWAECLAVARQIAEALKHAHDRGIIHRDLKPANILICGNPDGPAGLAVKLTDFGVAKLFASPPLTAAGGFVGTAAYLAPELAAGKPPGKRSDLYSLGCVTYALLTGRPPFPGQSITEVLHQHRFAQPEQPIRIVPDLPHDINALVLQLLEKDPAKRPADASQLIKSIDRITGKLERLSRSASDATNGQDLDATLLQPPDVSGPRPTAGPGPATFAAGYVRAELERLNRGGPIARFFNHPVVLVTLLALCIAAIVYGIRRPYAEDAPAPPDGEFDRLVREDSRRRGRAIARVQRDGVTSEAERFYLLGLGRLQAGDPAGAKAVWSALSSAYAGVESERRWVTAAKDGLAELADLPAGGRPAASAALERAGQLIRDGQTREAIQLLDALATLYHDDPAAAEIRRQIEQLRRSMSPER